ncbi:hypothetical protein KA037_00130 [Patescibacteria group bacterium]|nr:hypothetical protein [Patescibacteria group bacterium]MBP7841078.1 hypothetical protein [Patescibacteria group bacterium]
MRTFNIGEKIVEIDDTKEYLDFYREEGEPKLVSLDIVKLLMSLESQEMSTSDIKAELDHLKRRVIEAPRKKWKRDMRKEGFTVITTDELFEADGGEEIIQKLENT